MAEKFYPSVDCGWISRERAEAELGYKPSLLVSLKITFKE